MTVDPVHRPEVSAHFAREVVASARLQGMVASELLAAASIPPELVGEPQGRISPAQLGALLREVWLRGDDELLGRLAARHRYGYFNLMARHMVSCDTLGEALRYSCHYLRMTSEALGWDLSVSADGATLTLKLRPPINDPAHYMEEFLLLIWHRFSGWLVGEWIPLAATGFSYSPPDHVAEYRLMFGSELCFEQKASFLKFDRSLLDAPVVRNNRDLRRYSRGLPDEWFIRQRFGDSLGERLLDALANEVPPPNLDSIAERWGMSGRTLHRRLKSEGSSYRQLLAQFRRDRAIGLLLNSNCRVREVAQELGMTEPAFSRAFRQWTGQAPLAWRRRHR